MTTPREGIHRLACEGPLRASVVLLHGYAAGAVVNLGDGAAFADEHTEVVLPDAPGHGAREDGTLAQLVQLSEERRRDAIVDLATRWAGELTSLAADCRERGARRVGLVGISMGGLAAFASLAHARSFDAVAAVLAWPASVDEARLEPGVPPLLIGIAGRDESVPPEPSRRFAERYGAELHEYPESGHRMREGDWHDLWGATAAFMRRHLTDPVAQREA